MRFLKKLLGETDALEEAKREAGDLEGGQVEAPEAATMPEEPAEMPQDEDERSNT